MENARTRLYGLSWSHFLNDGAANYLPGILPALLVQMNLSVSLAGTIVGALLVGQGLQPFVGLLADRMGGRALVFAGLAGSSLGGALVGFIDGPALLLGVLILIGVCNSLFHPQALAGVRRLTTGGQGASMSVFLVGGEIGRGVWPWLASWVVVAWGLGALWVLALPALVTLPLLWRWAPPLPARQRNQAPIAWARHAGPLSLLVGFCALRALMTFCVVTFAPVLWAQAGGGLTAGASFITVLMVVGIIGNLGGGWISDRHGTRAVLIIGMAASSVLMALFVLLQGIWLWLVLALLGIALFATLPLTIVVAQNMLPENPSFGSGMALGLANGVAALGVIALGPVAGWELTAPLWIAAGGGALAVVLAALLPDQKPS